MDAVRFREYQVHSALAPFVKCLWSMESDREMLDAGRERILPDACVELVIHFHDPFRSHFADRTSSLQPQAFVVGQMKRYMEIEPAGRMGFIAVRFYARGAYHFFQRPLSEIAAGIVDLEDIWKQSARQLTERIVLVRDMETRVRIVETSLLALVRKNRRCDPTVDRCLQLIAANRGQMNVSQLAGDLGVSTRQLARRFQQSVGISPKEFARVSRFLTVIRSLTNPGHSTFTETALECGYFDQAHFNHEFRELAGMAPSELFTFPNVAF